MVAGHRATGEGNKVRHRFESMLQDLVGKGVNEVSTKQTRYPGNSQSNNIRASRSRFDTISITCE